MFRRAPHIVSYWRGPDLRVCDYLNRIEVKIRPPIIDILHVFDRWRSLTGIAADLPHVPGVLLRKAVARLVDVGLLRRSDAAPVTSDRAFAAWHAWMPQAALFHFATKDVRYATDGEVRQRRSSVPAPLKHYPRHRRVKLFPVENRGVFPRVLQDRRTWRRFGHGALAQNELSTLLGLTWGVQHWMHVPGQRRMALKTSPSGGARHSIEAYVLALRVRGLKPGLYHYAPDAHALVRLRSGATPDQVGRYLPAQPGYRRAAAIVIMTSVFARARARYPYSRAYRSVLIEAGHLCQTFCLLATWLGLAPFCTMALADSVIERDLEIDGISESVIYVAGVGTRPPGTDWAPWAEGSWQPPRRSLPKHERGARRSPRS